MSFLTIIFFSFFLIEQLKVLNGHIPQVYEKVQSEFELYYSEFSQELNLLIELFRHYHNSTTTATRTPDQTFVELEEPHNNTDAPRQPSTSSEMNIWIDPSQSSCSKKSNSSQSHTSQCSNEISFELQNVRRFNKCIKPAVQSLTRLMQLRTLYIELFQIVSNQVS